MSKCSGARRLSVSAAMASAVLAPTWVQAQMTMPPLPQFGPPPSEPAPPAPAHGAPTVSGDQTTPEGGALAPLFAEGYASDDRVRAAAGDISYSMDKCAGSPISEDQRVVRVQISTGGSLDDDVIDTLLVQAAQYAWAQCPRPFIDMPSGQQNGHFHYDVSEVDLYDPDGQLAYQAELGGMGMGDQGLWPGQKYVWQHFRNVLNERATQQQAAQAQAARTEAVAAQQAVQAQADAASEAAGKRTATGFGDFLRLLILAGIGFWLWVKRYPILRFLYGLTPHPATEEVNAAISSGRAYDPERLHALLSIMPENAAEREVRARQARDLSGRLTAHANRMKAEAEEATEFLANQARVSTGMEGHARVKRRLETILRERRKAE